MNKTSKAALDELIKKLDKSDVGAAVRVLEAISRRFAYGARDHHPGICETANKLLGMLGVG